MAERTPSDAGAVRRLQEYITRTYPNAERVTEVRHGRVRQAYVLREGDRERYILTASTNARGLTARTITVLQALRSGDLLLLATSQVPGVVFKCEVDETAIMLLQAATGAGRQDGYCHIYTAKLRGATPAIDIKVEGTTITLQASAHNA